MLGQRKDNPAEDLAGFRRKILTVLCISTGIAGLGLFSGFTVSSVLGAELVESKWAGLPIAFASLGLAAVPVPLSAMMERYGRRRGLVAGYLSGSAGSALSIIATVKENVALLFFGMFLVGVMYGAMFLSRYAAGDVTERSGRGRAISLVTWSLVVGALVGPNLSDISGNWAASLQLPRLTGPFIIGAVASLLSAILIFSFLRPDPLEIARRRASISGTPKIQHPPAARSELVRINNVQVAMISMGFSQFVMVMVMAITAVHVVGHHSLALAGFVISSHFFGMFGLSPLLGWAVDRWNRKMSIGVGQVVIAGGTFLAFLAPTNPAALTVSLFLIGAGWNMNLVGCSALLTDALPPASRLQMQGLADFLTGSLSVLASLISGFILAGIGFSRLGLIGGSLMLIPLTVVLTRTRVQPSPA